MKAIRASAALLAMGACATPPVTQVNELFSGYQGESTPGAAVRVIRDGQVVLSQNFGMANLETHEAVTPTSNFRLASITKPFTAMCILLLIEDGLLNLGTALPDVFPDFPAYGTEITVELLLQHRAGLRDYEPLVPEDATEQVRDADVLEMMKRQEAGYFPPGETYRYSNSGYAVLAMIVEERSGRSFASFVDERILQPAGMLNSVAFEDGVSVVPHRAMGYTVTDAGIDPTDQSLYSAVLGDGGLYSSVEDLTRWDAALYGDHLISAESKLAMWTPALENYGFGWRIDRYRGYLRHHHSGSTSGFRNDLQRFPEERLTVIVLTNRAEPDVDRLGEQVADIFLPNSPR